MNGVVGRLRTFPPHGVAPPDCGTQGARSVANSASRSSDLRLSCCSTSEISEGARAQIPDVLTTITLLPRCSRGKDYCNAVPAWQHWESARSGLSRLSDGLVAYQMSEVGESARARVVVGQSGRQQALARLRGKPAAGEHRQGAVGLRGVNSVV